MHVGLNLDQMPNEIGELITQPMTSPKDPKDGSPNHMEHHLSTNNRVLEPRIKYKKTSKKKIHIKHSFWPVPTSQAGKVHPRHR